MNNLEQIMNFNRTFVENREFEQYRTSRFPDKKMVIVTCMDTRLVELLPRAMNLRNGDVKIVKNAGALVTQPFGNIMRSILVAIYELGAKEVLVVGHHDCGMTGINPEQVISKMKQAGVKQEVFDTLEHSGFHLSRWLTGFDTVKDSVERSVSIIRNHPLLPRGIPVHGLIIDPDTGALEVVTEGYSQLKD